MLRHNGEHPFPVPVVSWGLTYRLGVAQTAAEKAMLDLAITANGKTLGTANGDRTASAFAIGSTFIDLVYS